MKHLLTFGLAFELHHRPSPNTSVMKQAARSTLEVLLHLRGKGVKKKNQGSGEQASLF